MGKPWIEQLAAEVKSKGRDAAESYGRDQHNAGIVAAQGKIFFTSLLQCIEQDVSEIRGQLQGSAVSCETSVVKEGPTQIRLIRERFPWFDATLKHDDMNIVFDYVQGRGMSGDKKLFASTNRQTIHFAFSVDRHDGLSVIPSFEQDSTSFEQPEMLSKYILELLFKE
jgi:hypothetical protein